MKNKKNGLELNSIKSTAKTDYGELNFSNFNDLEKFLNDNFKESGFIVAYLDYGVIIRKYENGKILLKKDENAFEPKFIQKLRLFNKNKEFFIYRTEGKWKARLRDDLKGNEVSAVDANQVLFGTKAEILDNGFTKLTEERGTEIILPFKVNGVDEKKNRVKIKTRNYINFNELEQAGYVDSRFVEFTFGIDNKNVGGN